MGQEDEIGIERQRFAEWLFTVYHLEAEWQPDRNCYKEFGVHLAWKAWKYCTESWRAGKRRLHIGDNLAAILNEDTNALMEQIGRDRKTIDRQREALEAIAFGSLDMPMAAGSDDSTKVHHLTSRAMSFIRIAAKALEKP